MVLLVVFSFFTDLLKCAARRISRLRGNAAARVMGGRKKQISKLDAVRTFRYGQGDTAPDPCAQWSRLSSMEGYLMN